MGKAVPIALDDTQRTQLQTLARSRTTSARLAERYAIVLRAADGLQDVQIANRRGLVRQKVARWRKRYAQSGFAVIEKDAPPPERKRTLADEGWQL